MALMESGFAAIANIHALMSFHDPHSDVSRLNRLASQRAVPVNPATMQVLRVAQRVSQASAGVFDITVAPRLVANNFLPRPVHCPEPDPRATWHDIQLLPHNRVRFRRPLWIDLGGIAKGYAVDVALTAMRRHSQRPVQINAGGDLRVSGALTANVMLDVPGHRARQRPVAQIRNASLASSCGWNQRRRQRGRWLLPHERGASVRPCATTRFVSVSASRAVIADALTKVVMAQGLPARVVLRRFGASGWLHDPRRGWQKL